MTNRELLKSYVKNGGERFICSPQIGAGAGFDAKMCGKEWNSEVTPEDTKKVCEMFDMVPLYNFGLDLSGITPDCKYETVNETTEASGRRRWGSVFKTPKGELYAEYVEEPKSGVVPVKYPVTEADELEILDYYLDSLLEAKDFSSVTANVAAQRASVGENEAIDIQWATQPYELLGFPSTMDTAIFALECPDVFRQLMDKILKLDEHLIKAVAAGGSDFIFLGGPGSEMISPKYYEDFLVPYSKIVSEMAHKEGLLIYSHVCSPIEPMLTMGYYGQMGIDLFETLSGPPVGNVKSVEDAFSKLPQEMCTRGNIGLDRLLNSTPDEIKEESFSILETAKRMGRKHILAASDYMFYDTKAENVHAMCEAVREFNGKQNT